MTENNESHPAPFKSLLGKDNTKKYTSATELHIIFYKFLKFSELHFTCVTKNLYFITIADF